ncbi:MAG: hypothetical protein RJA22_1247 [Verrucomicrobiota bacterium]|jgi:DNA-binding response OmpR family regulator/HPt (histidine-containing phosphotransfer) domain-containing protein
MTKVLIIEDDPIVAHIYRTRLEKEGFAIETSNDGQAGFYRTHEFHPDAILLDLMLPKMNGIEILKKLRAQPTFGHTPILVFTNAYVPNMIQEAFAAGASQIFNKATVTPRQIVDALHTVFRGSGGQSAPRPQPTGTPAPAAQADGQPSLSEASFHDRGTPAATPGTASIIPLPATPPVLTEEDTQFQSALIQDFTQGRTDIMAGIRRAAQEFSKAPDDAKRLPALLELYRKVHSLTGTAGVAGFTNISQMSAALEVLLKELHEKPKNINVSTLRTVVHSVDFISELFLTDEPEAGEPPASSILVVDDEILSRRAITYALEKAGLKSVSVEDPNVALNLAGEHKYELIFLDVQMPGMDGFELCTRMRATAQNRTTPIIFVTSLTDFKSRAKSTLSGGTDLIAKPFMFIELSVKALTHVLRGRMALKRQAA